MAFSVKLYWTDPITRDVLTIRRLRAPTVPTWLEFVGILKALYGNEIEDDRDGMYAVKWLDEENDIITIGSQMEWDEAVAATSRPMKLFVMTQKCTEVAPQKEEKVVTNADVTHEGKTYTVTPKYFYSPAGKVPISTKERQQLSAAVQSILACYPPPLPQWLTAAVRVFPNGVDFLYDVDISLLTTALHNRARLLINEGNASDALPLLAHTAALTPCDPAPHLDMALCHAHTGDMRRAVVAIKKYYDQGGVDHSAVWAVCDVGNVRESGLLELVRSEFPDLIVSALDDQIGDACDAHVGAPCGDDNQSEGQEDESDSEDEESEDEESDDDTTDSDSSVTVTESSSTTTSQDDFSFRDEDDDDDEDDEDDKRASVFEYEEVPSHKSLVLGGSDLTEDIDMTEEEDDHAYGSDVNEIENSVDINDESDEEDEESEEEEEDEDEMLEQKLRFLEELGFVDRVMVAHVLRLYKGSIEHFIDDQCP